MKLNLGCGQDVRLGYTNIDIAGGPNVTRGDVRNLDSAGITDASADEILALDIIQYIKLKELGAAFQSWIKKLAPGGYIHIESLDYNQIGNSLAYDYITVNALNDALYGEDKVQGIYNLIAIETVFTTFGFTTVMKGYKDSKFYLRVTK